jgi:outer membrane murein-binding lipoprotein Lpp
MKKRVLLYALIFLALLAIYQYVSMNKMYEKQSTKIEDLRTKITNLENEVKAHKDTTQTLLDENLDLLYFSLQGNGEALEYFAAFNFTADELIQKITDAIYDKNTASANNPLVPFDGMEGRFMAVDKVKVINHKWILCSFTDGGYWGEMILRYELDKNQKLSFELITEVLYPKYQG